MTTEERVERLLSMASSGLPPTPGEAFDFMMLVNNPDLPRVMRAMTPCERGRLNEAFRNRVIEPYHNGVLRMVTL
jgi:hypothetical protein